MSDFSKRRAGYLVACILLLVGAWFALAPLAATAQTAIATPFTPQVPLPGTGEFSGGKPITVSPTLLAEYIKTIYRIGLWLAITLAIFMTMVGGFLWVVSAGSPERVNNAKSYIGSSLTGLIVALSSFILLQTVNPELVVLKPIVVEAPKNLQDVGCCCSARNGDTVSACTPMKCDAASIAEGCPKIAGSGITPTSFDRHNVCFSNYKMSSFSHWEGSTPPGKTLNFYGACSGENINPTHEIALEGSDASGCCVLDYTESGGWFWTDNIAKWASGGNQTCYNIPAGTKDYKRCCQSLSSNWYSGFWFVKPNENCASMKSKGAAICDRGIFIASRNSAACK